MTERYGRSNQPDAERGWDQNWQNPRQQQQFTDSDHRQHGDFEETDRIRNWDRQQGNEAYPATGNRESRSLGYGQERGGYGRDTFGRSSYADQGRFSDARYRDREDRDYRGTLRAGQYGGAYGERDRSGRNYGYGDSGYGYGAERFESFTGNDFGGRDFTRGSNALYGGSYGTSYGRSSDHNDYSGWREYGESRGFLERAGDEIASWFGDEDAARRRRQDHSGRGPEGYTRSDERIREDVNDALTRDWAVDATKVTVKVQNGEVTLDGTVPSRTAKRKAEDCAEDVSGVKHVQNNLRVQEHSVTSTSTPSGTVGTGSTTTGATRTTR